MSKVTIKLVVDAVGALESGSMAGNLYAFDTNRRAGSKGSGTDALKTAVSRETQITWMIAPLECEAYVALEDIVIDRTICEPVRKTFPGTSVSYWTGTVRKGTQIADYDLVFTIGSHGRRMVHSDGLSLVPAARPSAKGEAQ